MSENDDEAMLIARQIVENHSYHFGMVPHPDPLKDAIARSLRAAAKVTFELARIGLTPGEQVRDG